MSSFQDENALKPNSAVLSENESENELEECETEGNSDIKDDQNDSSLEGEYNIEFPVDSIAFPKEWERKQVRERSQISKVCFRFSFGFWASTFLLWLNVVVHTENYDVPKASLELLVQDLPPQENCTLCNISGIPSDASFPVDVTFNLTDAPDGSRLMIFASNNARDWYVGAEASPLQVVSERTTHIAVKGGCFGVPGPLAIVGCLLRSGQEKNFKQGKALLPPPFDDRCSVLGSKCTTSCSTFHSKLSACSSLQKDILSAMNGGALPAGTHFSHGPWTFVFVLLSILLYVTTVSNYLPGIFNEEDIEFPNLCDLENEDISLNVFTAAKGESNLLCFRQLFGTFLSLRSLKRQLPNISIHHYFFDDTEDGHFKTLWAAIITAISPPTFDWEAIERDQVFHQSTPFDATVADLTHSWAEVFREADNINASNIPFSRFISLEGLDWTFQYVPKEGRKGGKGAALQQAVKFINSRGLKANEFLAILDCRHLPSSGFWASTIPRLFRVMKRPKYTQEELSISPRNIHFVQVMQNFPTIDHSLDDVFDRQNGSTYLLYNEIRKTIGAVTSCGTNAIWRLRTGFNFSCFSTTEDTETSHDIILASVSMKGKHPRPISDYVSEPHVAGIVKDFWAFMESTFRWSRGSVQCLVKNFSDIWPVLLGFFLFIGIFTVLVHNVHNADLFFYIYGATVLGLVMFRPPILRHLALLLIVVSNDIYWLTGISSVFWVIVLPTYVVFTNDNPLKLNFALFLGGSLLFTGLRWIMVSSAQRWGKCSELHLWRTETMWMISWPLHLCSFVLCLCKLVEGKLGEEEGWKSVKWPIRLLSFTVSFQTAILFAGLCWGSFNLIKTLFLGTHLFSGGFSGHFLGTFLCAISLFPHIRPLSVLLFNRIFFFSTRHYTLLISSIWVLLFLTLGGVDPFHPGTWSSLYPNSFSDLFDFQWI